jgi:hypothetical protein
MLELDVIIAVWARRRLKKKMERGRKMGGATCSMRQAKQRVILDYFLKISEGTR